MLMIYSGINDVVSDSLSYNILGIFRAVQLKFGGYISERYLRVGDVDHSDSSLDDVVSQTYNERVGAVSPELLSVLTQRVRELCQVTCR